MNVWFRLITYLPTNIRQCTGFGHDLNHIISKFLSPPDWANCSRKRKQWLLLGGELLRLYTLTQSCTNSQKKEKKSGYMLDVPTILVARLPSEEISLSQRRLLWTELSLFSCVTPILQFVRIAEISRVKFRWRTLKSSCLKFLSCPWRSQTTPPILSFWWGSRKLPLQTGPRKPAEDNDE